LLNLNMTVACSYLPLKFIYVKYPVLIMVEITKYHY